MPPLRSVPTEGGELFDGLAYTVRRVNIAGTINFSADQLAALKTGRAVEILVTAVVQTRNYKRDKDGVRERITVVPIASEVQSVGEEIVDASQLAEPEAD